MEYIISTRLFLWGIIKRIYWLLPTLILDPFDLLKKVFNINYDMPQWSIWSLFVLGCFVAVFLTFHELRLKTYKQEKISWIEEYQKKHRKQLPAIPDYLLDVAPKYNKGEPISKNMELLIPSMQFWNNLLPSQQDELNELVEWTGKDPRDYLAEMKRRAPPSVYETRGIISF